VDHAAGHFSEGAEPLALDELLLGGVQLSDRLFQLGRARAHAIFQMLVLFLNFLPEKARVE
jgi:hypothetical protein